MRFAHLILLLSFSSPAVLQRVPDSEERITYEVKSVRTSEGWALDFAIRNRGRDAISAFRSSLPWASRDALILVAVTTGPRPECMREIFFVQDPIPDVVRVGHGETIAGRVFLKDRFLGWREALERTDIVVFWSFQLKSSDGPPFERKAGAFILGARLPAP